MAKDKKDTINDFCKVKLDMTSEVAEVAEVNLDIIMTSARSKIVYMASFLT